MEITQFISLLNNPNDINLNHIEGFETIIQKYPYLQSVKALYIKALFNQNSFKYNFELKKTAAFTKEREVLFDFITSKNFTILDIKTHQHHEALIKNLSVDFEEVIVSSNVHVAPPPIAFGISDDTFSEEIIESTIRLEIGKPLEFNQNEKHSFMEWLKLSQIQKINTQNKDNLIAEQDKNDSMSENYIDFSQLANFNKEETSKQDIIDNFLTKNPKIIPKKEEVLPPKSVVNPIDELTFTTETLAKIYTEQKKYQKAIQAYEILILKYPEKSVFFANQIKDLKILQQHK